MSDVISDKSLDEDLLDVLNQEPSEQDLFRRGDPEHMSDDLATVLEEGGKQLDSMVEDILGVNFGETDVDWNDLRKKVGEVYVCSENANKESVVFSLVTRKNKHGEGFMVFVRYVTERVKLQGKKLYFDTEYVGMSNPEKPHELKRSKSSAYSKKHLIWKQAAWVLRMVVTGKKIPAGYSIKKIEKPKPIEEVS